MMLSESWSKGWVKSGSSFSVFILKPRRLKVKENFANNVSVLCLPTRPVYLTIIFVLSECAWSVYQAIQDKMDVKTEKIIINICHA